MQRISKTKFVNAIQHLTDSLGEKPKMKDIANYLNEQNKFSSDLIAYYIKKYECADCILKNDWLYSFKYHKGIVCGCFGYCHEETW